MVFEHLIRYWGVPYWIRRKEWKKAQKLGRCYFNIFRNGRGLGCNFVVMRTQGIDKYNLVFGLPTSMLLDAAKEIKKRNPARKGKKQYKWKKQVIVDEHGKVLWVKKK